MGCRADAPVTVPCMSQQQRYEERIAHFLARVSVCTVKTLECYQASPVMAGSFASTELGHRAAHSLLSRAELGFFRRASRSVRLKALIPLILTTSSSHKTLSEQQVRTDEASPGSLWQPPRRTLICSPHRSARQWSPSRGSGVGAEGAALPKAMSLEGLRRGLCYSILRVGPEVL